MQLRDVDLRSVGHSSQKLWPKTFWENNALYFALHFALQCPNPGPLILQARQACLGAQSF